MSTSDWSARLAEPETVRQVLGAPPPPLTDYDLFLVHIDERESAVTLGFFAFGVPAGAAARWESSGHNAVEFFLVCTGVKNLAVDGWTHEPMTGIALDVHSAVLSGERQRAAFDFEEIRAEALRGLTASREP